MFLLDTVVLSELRKRERNPGVVRWLDGKPSDSLFLSVVTIGEIERGISRQRGKDAVLPKSWERGWTAHFIFMRIAFCPLPRPSPAAGGI